MDDHETRKVPVRPTGEKSSEGESPEFERQLQMMAELLLDIYLDKQRRQRPPEF